MSPMTWPQLHKGGGALRGGGKVPKLDLMTIRAVEIQAVKLDCSPWGQPESLGPGGDAGEGPGLGVLETDPKSLQPGVAELEVDLSEEAQHFHKNPGD